MRLKVFLGSGLALFVLFLAKIFKLLHGKGSAFYIVITIIIIILLLYLNRFFRMFHEGVLGGKFLGLVQSRIRLHREVVIVTAFHHNEVVNFV